ncbi:hypothetical protein SVAN01_01342 [Stagonosporopsis vannaccii]|nr:hypothetical protein SVAN01_01342 [Stagonosporopsis vannaccii]
MKAFGFSRLVGVAIGYGGSWWILEGAGNALCEWKWSEVSMEKYRCYRGVERMVIEGEDMEVERGQRAAMSSADVFEGRFRAAKVDVKTT